MISWPRLAASALLLALSSGAHAQPPVRVASAFGSAQSAAGTLGPLLVLDSVAFALARGHAAREGVGAWIADTTEVRPAPWWAPLASAAVPGAGQVALRQWRAVGYVALEAFGLVQHLRSNADGRRERREYERLARVARAPFSPTLPNGNQAYYERMLHYMESGVFDHVPGGDLDPELDANTFNGSIWLLARRTYWEDPEQPPARETAAYRSAEDFYLDRAIRPEFRWSWVSAPTELQLFRDAVVRSNDSFRDAGLYLGAILANHALSAVDAYVTVRLRSESSGERAYGLEGSIPWAPFGRSRPR